MVLGSVFLGMGSARGGGRFKNLHESGHSNYKISVAFLFIVDLVNESSSRCHRDKIHFYPHRYVIQYIPLPYHHQASKSKTIASSIGLRVLTNAPCAGSFST